MQIILKFLISLKSVVFIQFLVIVSQVRESDKKSRL
jgi:hypothetical protein